MPGVFRTVVGAVHGQRLKLYYTDLKIGSIKLHLVNTLYKYFK